MKLLNIGCGTVFHSAWVNVDLVSSSPKVQICDIRKKLPYPDAYFDACYSSHVMEHLKQEEAEQFLAECWRILKPKGIVRVVVPDLELIVREYLKTLEQIDSCVKKAEHNYDWMMLELYDQTVRSFSGGQMACFLANPNIANQEFVRSRIGYEVENNSADIPIKKSILKRVRLQNLSRLIKKSRNTLAKFLVTLIADGEWRQACEEGIFRNSGEIHRWMYDRFSMRRLLEKTGFIDVCTCQANISRIPNFNSYNLDILKGRIRKPDSLFMEGTKPEKI